MSKDRRNDVLDMRLFSDSVPLKDSANSFGLEAGAIHEKGKHFILANGHASAHPAKRHYLALGQISLDGPVEGNRALAKVLGAVASSLVAEPIRSGVVEANVVVGAFAGDIDWPARLDRSLLAVAARANIGIEIDDYEHCDENGVPRMLTIIKAKPAGHA